MEIGSSMVVNEMARGRDLARRLQADIDAGLSVDTWRALVEEILSAFDNTISMVASGALIIGNSSSSQQQEVAAVGTEFPPWPVAKSPRSESSSTELERPSRTVTKSPRSESSSAGAFEVQRMEAIKKRKIEQKWTFQVRFDSDPGTSTIDDGYSWRKYGLKEILGARHPRSYYRCIYRRSHGCPALMVVQRSEDDPLVFKVTYCTTHTCESASRVSLLQDQDLLLSFQTGLKMEKTLSSSTLYQDAEDYTRSLPLVC